jgi:hypothetical protein
MDPAFVSFPYFLQPAAMVEVFHKMDDMLRTPLYVEEIKK